MRHFLKFSHNVKARADCNSSHVPFLAFHTTFLPSHKLPQCMTTISFFAERERERLEEKKQRESEKTTSKAEEEVKAEEAEESTTLPSPAINEVEPAKELKIEVHATAVHHEQIQPIVAHAQSHEISHEHAVSCSDFVYRVGHKFWNQFSVVFMSILDHL